MMTAEIRLVNQSGLHARPASKLVQTAAAFDSKVRIANLDVDPLREVDAKSILAVLTLGAGAGTRVRLRAEGRDEAEAIGALIAAIRSGLGDETVEPKRLTRRQEQVLKLVASGLSRKQVALRLGLSEHTVRGHLTRLYASLGVHDAAHAVMSAVQAGLLEP